MPIFDIVLRIIIMSQIPKYVSVAEAVSAIRSNQRVFIQGSAATPLTLLSALEQRSAELKKVELVSISTLGNMNLGKAEYKDSFYFNSLFVSANIRQAVNENRGDYIPIFLSEIPKMFNKQIMPLDVALIHVSPPDKHGFCSLGVSVDIARSAVRNSKYVIAQVNPQMPSPRVRGIWGLTWAITYFEFRTAERAMSTETPSEQKPCLSGGET